MRPIVPAPVLILLLSSCTTVFGDEEFAARFRPHLVVCPAQGVIRIDGELDDPGWTGAARADRFAEVQPGDQVRPPVESEAWVTYDRENLYIALVAFDDPTAIRVSLRDRDNIFTDDYFGIMLDTYGDLAWGYELFVNPLGIQGDLRMLSNGEEDLAFDLVWESEGKVTDSGYQVEIAIPFASLRFPDRAEQRWRVNFWRDHQREVRRRYAWAAIDRDDPCFMCQWGSLSGIEGIRPGTNFEVIANVIGQQSGGILPDGGFRDENPEAEASVNLRYAISSHSSTELAINPDFSQVESDAGQIDVNEPFALFFPEKRPFFQEGSDLYQTWIDVVYTRSINNPGGAAKIAGRLGKTGFAYLFARDHDSPILIPLPERTFLLRGGRSVVNIARAKHTLGDESFFGATATDRRLDGGGSGSVVSLDTQIRLLRTLRMQVQGILSHTKEPDDSTLTAGLEGITFDGGRHTVAFDGEEFSGHGIFAAVERNGRTWNAEIEYLEQSPGFRTDNGFTIRNDLRQINVWTGLWFQPNGRRVIQWEPSVGLGRIWNMAGGFEDEWITPGFYLHLTRQTDLNVSYTWSRERYRDEIYDGIRVARVSGNTRPWEILSLNGGVSWGHRIWRTFTESPVLGQSLDVEAGATVKPAQRMQIGPSFAYARMLHPDSGDEIFEGFILRARLDYQFTREFFARIIAEYDDFDDSFRVEPLLTYRLNAFSIFYVGMNGGYGKLGPADFEAGASRAPSREEWRLTARQFFAKIQYLFRI